MWCVVPAREVLPMDLIRCPRCAKEIPDASRFCRRCGCALSWRTPHLTATILPPLPPPPMPFPRAAQTKPASAAVEQSPARRTVTRRTPAKCGGGGGGLIAVLGIGATMAFLNAQRAAHRYPATPATPAPTISPYRFPTSPRPAQAPPSYPKPLPSTARDTWYTVPTAPATPQQAGKRYPRTPSSPGRYDFVVPAAPPTPPADPTER